MTAVLNCTFMIVAAEYIRIPVVLTTNNSIVPVDAVYGGDGQLGYSCQFYSDDS